ncbi:hypothetical protein TEPIDINF_000699 [Tepidibacillus infernus]|uniref:Uncharacterized protein n=1 Tax=Tepidibacillus decaturensis TaxID=1413211 RepID=A0A135L396_9BACI|nr:hypothetical protein [Tepidibacillus decaturensis]KXG43333.1 hypothetical protein U473_04360 [Tepidibacillus decaturensis]
MRNKTNKSLYPTTMFITGPRDQSTWRTHSRHQHLQERKMLFQNEIVRPQWFLKHLHDKMIGMRS